MLVKTLASAMKQTHKITLHSIFHLFLFGGLIFAVASLRLPAAPAPEAPDNQPPPAITTNSPQKQTRIVTAKATKTTVATTASASPKQDTIKADVQHEYVYHMFAAPSDPSYASNWALTKINAPAAWDVTTGNGSTTVAVIDTGFGLTHEDLTNRWYQNSGETGTTKLGDRCWTGTPVSKATNHCDDDNNGYVDDWRGWSFVQSDNNPQAGRQDSAGSGISHGTEVAGIVGAETNNGVGVAALDWNTKIMPLQVLDDSGTGYTSDVTAAIYYAVDNGAQVINMSLGAYANDPALKTAVDYATAHKVVITAAAGNCGDAGEPGCEGVVVGTVAYPAAYPDVIAVGATDSTDHRAAFSSYGPSIDVSAPGYAVPSSTAWSAGNQTSLYSSALYGTSFASPQVASLAALIKSIRPSTSVADITALIDATASKPSTLGGLNYTQQLGHGVINAGVALSIAAALNSQPATPTLLQAGAVRAEHVAFAGNTLGSGCDATTASACTISLTGDSGYTRYLPYAILSASGSVDWSWSADMLEGGNWAIRARDGESLSSTPYYLTMKG
jgi:subtilisin family serine protease